MNITPQARDRLNALMEDRRLALGITWRELARSAGVSYEAVRALRRGPGGIAELTARKLDRALQWQPGSIAVIIGGHQGVPVPLPPQGAPVTGLRPAVVRDYWDSPVIGPAVRGIWDADPELVPLDQKLALIESLARTLESGGSGNVPVANGP